MSQRIALFLSIALTAFTLVIVGALMGGGIAALGRPTTPTLDPKLVNQIQNREAAYQTMIAQANATFQQTPTVPTPTATDTPVPPPVYPITSELAAWIALSADPNGTLLKTPELVNYQGVVAYEVTLDNGLIDVDANSGAILYNGAARPVISVSSSDGERDD
jgi:uncharacterized membrane protein YkoI